MASSFPEPDIAQALYRMMVRIRAFENAAEAASQGGVSAYGQQAAGTAQVRGPLHLSTGQEAVPAGVCAHLRPGDLLTSTHRGHGHTLAKGADLGRMMAELFGKATGFNGGKGGSMHIADFSVGMLGANGVVAAGLPIAVGAAHAQKLQRGRSPVDQDAITVCFFGDGAINRGPFLEALNWARVYALPVLFVCEDNRWSATTASGPMTAGDGASARALALDIPATQVDGNDVFAVHATAATLIAEVRADGGPRLLHALTYRVKGHVSVDAAAYRDPAELAAALTTDPIERTHAVLRAAGVPPAALDAIADAARDEVTAALVAADAAPWPVPEAAFTDVQTTGADQWF
ncbi:thiamine pyrophosphate-dependent dehydrogenase E1 component subunit alpha [Variovorax ginsengisoli]|uniref:Pyruvate dehydrogenase E1 component alpha subunit n=1 Tax=Variovorax ginsengisoli TaxID=363844 RepID=A0ABT9SCB6_9BURK|nr:thiamine pyrophosphate-dependent dehydrogenase E1 component subunit alpha [Variovorax ginsengisoli]MDP9901980.1 pyruvate dehydrogenase E1 component alpha subunit [Variovorax ginsengisoli]